MGIGDWGLGIGDWGLGIGDWVFSWYDFDDVAKTHIVKENVMERALSGKPKCYSIEKREDGSLKVNKFEGKLYDEDELKIALCKMALGD